MHILSCFHWGIDSPLSADQTVSLTLVMSLSKRTDWSGGRTFLLGDLNLGLVSQSLRSATCFLSYTLRSLLSLRAVSQSLRYIFWNFLKNQCFPNHKTMSSNVLLSKNQRDIQYIVMKEQRNQKYSHLRSWNQRILTFFLKKDSNQLINY